MKKSTRSLKSITLIFLAALFAVSSIPFIAYAEELTTGSCGDNATYSFDSETGTLTISGTGEVECDFDFDNKSSIKSIIIEEGITSLAAYSFNVCVNLQSVKFPESLTSIDYAAFSSCTNLTEINIPKNVNSIGSLAFTSSVNLEKIIVAEENEYYASVDNVLFNKDMTDLLIYAPKKTEISYSVPDGVTTISERAFEDAKNLFDIELPEGLEKIENSAFFCCENLQSITISSTVNDIASNAFQSCDNLETITVNEESFYFTSVDNVLFSKDMSQLLLYPAKKTDTSYIVPNSVTSIADYSFEYAMNLASVELPEGLEKIGDYAFYFCKSLQNITIPSTVTDIGSSAFYCENLEKIVLKSDNCAIKVTITSSDGSSTTIYETATIYANYNSTGQAYAEKYGNKFVPLCSDGTENHDFTAVCTYDADCYTRTETYTCTKCGYSFEENYENSGHVWGEYISEEGTGSHYRVCINDETHIEEQSCDWWGNIEMIEPTCTEQGQIIYNCTLCSAQYIEFLDKIPHEYVESVTAPTCTEQGYTTYTCANCGDTYIDDYTDALGHNFDDNEKYCLNGCNEENPNYKEETAETSETTEPEITTVAEPTTGKTNEPENTTVSETTTEKAVDLKVTNKSKETTTAKKLKTTNNKTNDEYKGSKDTDYADFRIIPGYGQIKAAWTADSKIEGYEVYISTDNSKFKKVADINAKNTDYYIIDNLSNGQIYYVKIKGYLHYNGKKISMNSFSNTQSLTVK